MNRWKRDIEKRIETGIRLVEKSSRRIQEKKRTVSVGNPNQEHCNLKFHGYPFLGSTSLVGVMTKV